MFKILAYAALGLAVLNVSEDLGFVQKGKYLGFLPRWEQSSSGSGLGTQLLNGFHTRMGQLHNVAELPAPLAPVLTSSVNTVSGAMARATHPDAIGDLITASN